MTDQRDVLDELEDDDKLLISDLFFEEIVPKLKKLGARLGTVSCEFAGTRYKSWNIRFNSMGSGFDIVEFEYDEESRGMDLDL
jgi:hypothetical protein